MVDLRIQSGVDQGVWALHRATRETSIHLERLSTGKKVNRASDDPAGMMVVTDIASRQKTIETRRNRIAFEQSYLGALDGAKSVVGDLLIDLRGSVLAGANKGGLTNEEQDAIQIEVDSILHTINGLSNTSEFNGQKLLGGLTTESLDLNGLFGGGANRISGGNLEEAASKVEAAISSVNSSRAAAGNQAKKLESEDRTLATELEAITGIRSSIEDADYAAEAAALVRSQMLEQAATYVTLFTRNLKAQTMMTLLGSVRQ